jgi:hypothetical protein
MTPEYKARFWAKVQKTPTCWLWTAGRGYHGYGQATHPDKPTFPIGAYRAAWIIAHGPVPKGLAVCHKCDNKLCVRPSHLFLGTQRDNLADMRAKGRGHLPPRIAGILNCKAKFTEDDIRDVRRLYAEGLSLRQLGRRYRVWYTTISQIVNRNTWAHVQ